MLGAFQDEDGYSLVTVCVPAVGEAALYESPLFRADTDDPVTEGPGTGSAAPRRIPS